MNARSCRNRTQASRHGHQQRFHAKMSNYTGKRRSGGGPNLSTPPAHFTAAEFSAADQVTASYNQDVSALTFTAASFTTTPDGRTPTSVTPTGGDTIRLDYGLTVTDQTDLSYSGTDPGLLSPDTIPF